MDIDLNSVSTDESRSTNSSSSSVATTNSTPSVNQSENRSAATNNSPSIVTSDGSSVTSSDSSSVSIDSALSIASFDSNDSFFQDLNNEVNDMNATFEEQVQQLRARERQEVPSLALNSLRSENSRISDAARTTLAQEILASSSSRNRTEIRESRVPNFTDIATKNTGGRPR